MDTKLLLEIGLTKSEIEVYTILLKAGSTKVGTLMKEISLHRSRVYEAINRLMEKGLVSYVIKNNVKFFEAADPDRLITYIEEQKEKLNEKENSIKSLIPELKQLVSPLKPHAEAHVLAGPEGFKTMRKDVLKQKKELYLIGGKGKEYHVLKYFFPNFEKLRIKNKIKWNILYDHNVNERDMEKRPLVKGKHLPVGYATPTVVNVYGDRVVSVLWKGNYPLCFMIINKDIADSYRKWFELMWKYSK